LHAHTRVQNHQVSNRAFVEIGTYLCKADSADSIRLYHQIMAHRLSHGIHSRQQVEFRVMQLEAEYTRHRMEYYGNGKDRAIASAFSSGISHPLLEIRRGEIEPAVRESRERGCECRIC